MAIQSITEEAIQETCEILRDSRHAALLLANVSSDLDEKLDLVNFASECQLRYFLFVASCVGWLGEMPE